MDVGMCGAGGFSREARATALSPPPCPYPRPRTPRLAPRGPQSLRSATSPPRSNARARSWTTRRFRAPRRSPRRRLPPRPPRPPRPPPNRGSRCAASASARANTSPIGRLAAPRGRAGRRRRRQSGVSARSPARPRGGCLERERPRGSSGVARARARQRRPGDAAAARTREHEPEQRRRRAAAAGQARDGQEGQLLVLHHRQARASGGVRSVQQRNLAVAVKVRAAEVRVRRARRARLPRGRALVL
mmetsp:Transcript_34677/g.114899  ORF Transcript_34677/g.114899 Transcript_34677/m.114899 type:complete len:246 (-) Transcript_34677:1949-2686(-)